VIRIGPRSITVISATSVLRLRDIAYIPTAIARAAQLNS